MSKRKPTPAPAAPLNTDVPNNDGCPPSYYESLLRICMCRAQVDYDAGWTLRLDGQVGSPMLGTYTIAELEERLQKMRRVQGEANTIGGR